MQTQREGRRIAGRLTVVIPTLNEASNVGWVLERLPEQVDEVVIVDGRSTDDTVAFARDVRPDAQVVYERRPGKGAALRAGFARARGDMIVMLDADGSMHPAEIGRYVAALQDGYDLVKGSRFMTHGGTADISRIRAIGNLGLLSLANRLYGCQFTELCYGFMGFWRSILPTLALTADGFEIESQMVLNALSRGLRVAEVPSFEAARRSGTSNLHAFRDGGRVLRELGRGRVRVPEGVVAARLRFATKAARIGGAPGLPLAQPSPPLATVVALDGVADAPAAPIEAETRAAC